MKISIDIGGTNTRIALFDDKLKKVDNLKMATDVKDPIVVFDKLVKFIEKHKNIEGIGISAPGVTDYKKGIIINSANIKGWNGFAFIDYLRERTGIQNICSDNDANLMALAQHFHFGGTKDDVTQFFTISTGLGAGLIINNEIFSGPTGLAQEVANAPTAWVQEKGKELGEGSVEYFAAGSGIALRAKKYASNTTDAFEKYDSNLNVKKIIDEGIEALANMIATSAALINPTIIAFDGSVARHNKWYVEKAINLSKKRMFPSQFKSIRFAFSELGDDAALIGACHLVKQNSKRS